MGWRMRDIDLFQQALGLTSPWFVERCVFDAERQRLDIFIDFERGGRFVCSKCGREGCSAYDAREDDWRHLNFFQHETTLRARVPRVSCAKCGVLKVNPPWARAGSGFTLLFEAHVLALVKCMPVLNVARIVGEQDTRIWRIIEHYVGKAHDAMDLSDVEQIACDETSARRGHDYVSLFADLATRKVIFVADGKSAEAVDEFGRWLEDHKGDKTNITDASIDMSAAFISGIHNNFPNANITFDKFHVVKLINEAVDEVRRNESRGNVMLKGTRYLWLKNIENLTDAQKLQLAELEGSNLDTMQAYQMRMNFQELFRAPSIPSARKFLKRWHAWVRTSQLSPMIKAAKTIMAKAEDILRAIANKISNGVLEAINGNVQAAKRKAKGYRSKHNLKLIIYMIAGDLLEPLPT
jgi:transposase